MSSKLVPVKTAAAAGLAFLSIGGLAAAAAGLAPAAGERAPAQASPHTPDGQVGHGQGDAATLIRGSNAAAATNSSALGKSSDHAAGPDASGAARHGLCQAWSAGRGDENGKRADSTAFRALAAAAGGPDRIAAYCREDAGASATHGQRPAERPDDGHEHGNGQHGPPTTTLRARVTTYGALRPTPSGWSAADPPSRRHSTLPDPGSVPVSGRG